MSKKLLTPEDAIRYLGLDRQGLRQPRESLRWLCRTGKLRFTKIGRYVRFQKSWLAEIVAANEVQPGKTETLRSEP